MDGVDPVLVDTAEAAPAAEPGVTAMHSVKMRWTGHRLHADAELDIDPGNHPHRRPPDPAQGRTHP